LKKLIILDVSSNYLKILPKEIIELKKLKLIIIDKEIVQDNTEILKQLKEKGIKIEDNEGNQLIEDIDSLEEPEKVEKEINKKVLVEPIELTKKTLSITDENYHNLTKEEKQEFIDESDFALVSKDIIALIMNETDIDILEDFTYNRTLPLGFLLATYNNNLDREEDELERLKENLLERNIKVLTWIAEWTIDAQENYIGNNIDNLNQEILLGYSMSTLPIFKNIREKIITFTTKLSKKKKETNDNEYYELALESFNNKDFEDALEYLKDYEVSSSKKEVLKSNIYKEIGQPFNKVKNELLSIREVFVEEGRTDIKKYIKELKLEDYPNLKFIISKLTTQEINSLTFSLTYIENVNNEESLYIKTIYEFYNIVENSLIKVSEEQNKVLENNILAWKDLKTGLV
jgi:hypothetical protein